MVAKIPQVTNWSVTPQNGQVGYFTLMNAWLFESTTVINSLKKAIDKMNEACEDINNIAENAINAITLDTVDDLATYTGTGLVIVKDSSRGGIFVSKTEVDINPNTRSLYAVNGGTVFAKLGGGFWVRQYSGAVNVKWFGAKSEAGFNNQPIFQAIINGISLYNTSTDNVVLSSDKIIIPAGEYEVHDTVLLNPFITIEGESKNQILMDNGYSGNYPTGSQTVIKAVGNFNGKAVFDNAPIEYATQTRPLNTTRLANSYDSGHIFACGNIQIRNLNILGSNDTATLPDKGINLAVCNYSVIENVRVSYCIMGIVTSGCWEVSVINNHTINCYIGCWQLSMTQGETSGNYFTRPKYDIVTDFSTRTTLPVSITKPFGMGVNEGIFGQKTACYLNDGAAVNLENNIMEGGQIGIGYNNNTEWEPKIHNNYIENISDYGYVIRNFTTFIVECGQMFFIGNLSYSSGTIIFKFGRKGVFNLPSEATPYITALGGTANGSVYLEDVYIPTSYTIPTNFYNCNAFPQFFISNVVSAIVGCTLIRAGVWEIDGYYNASLSNTLTLTLPPQLVVKGTPRVSLRSLDNGDVRGLAFVNGVATAAFYGDSRKFRVTGYINTLI